MKVMILAAGHGKRLRPFTDHMPKPLVSVSGKPLLEHILVRLRDCGYHEFVINIFHLGEQIAQKFGDGSRFGVKIAYSREASLLETGGGVCQALSLLSEATFVVVNGDLWTDYPFNRLREIKLQEAHLVLVDNPYHHMNGDYALTDGRVHCDKAHRLTFAGVGVYRREFFTGKWPTRIKLASLIDAAVRRGAVTGEHYQGEWMNIDTPARLKALEVHLHKSVYSEV